MDDKVFSLLEKMYTDLSCRMDNMSKEIQEVKRNMTTKQDMVRLEDKIDTNHRALYDGYKQSIEGVNDIREKLERLTDKVENQEIKLQVLKSVK